MIPFDIQVRVALAKIEQLIIRKLKIFGEGQTVTILQYHTTNLMNIRRKFSKAKSRNPLDVRKVWLPFFQKSISAFLRFIGHVGQSVASQQKLVVLPCHRLSG